MDKILCLLPTLPFKSRSHSFYLQKKNMPAKKKMEWKSFPKEKTANILFEMWPYDSVVFQKPIKSGKCENYIFPLSLMFNFIFPVCFLFFRFSTKMVPWKQLVSQLDYSKRHVFRLQTHTGAKHRQILLGHDRWGLNETLKLHMENGSEFSTATFVRTIDTKKKKLKGL